MGVRLARQLTSRDALSPGQYYVHEADFLDGVKATVYVSCPLCGLIGVVSPTHIIEPRSGKVLPAYLCLGPGCSFHDWVYLDSYLED